MLSNNQSTGSGEWTECGKSQGSKNVSPMANECVEKNSDLKIMKDCDETLNNLKLAHTINKKKLNAAIRKIVKKEKRIRQLLEKIKNLDAYIQKTNVEYSKEINVWQNENSFIREDALNTIRDLRKTIVARTITNYILFGACYGLCVYFIYKRII